MEHSKPTLKPWRHTGKNEYYVRVVFNDGVTPPEKRYPLGIKDLENLDRAIETFRQDRLPAIIAARKPTQLTAEGSTLREAYQWYVGKYLPDLGRSTKTVDAYDRILFDFTAYCRTKHIGRVQQITPDLFRDWQADRTDKRKGNGAAKRDELLCVRRFFEVCAEDGKLPDLNIKWTIPGKTKSRRFRALDADEIKAIHAALDADPPHPHLLIRWHLLTPWLPSDVLDFRAGEYKGEYIDRDRIKTSRQMLYPVTPDMAAIIVEATAGRKLHRADHIFVNDAAPWEYHQLEKQTRWWQKKHGLDFTFRDLRVTFATRLANAGCPPNVLAELMSHEDIETTLQYYVRVDIITMRAWATHVTSPTYVPIAPTMYQVQEKHPKTQ